MADKRLNKAEQQLAEANRRADEATKQVKEATKQVKEARVREEAIERVRNKRLNKAEQQLAEANRRADEANKQVNEVRVREEAIIERVRVQGEAMAHSEELSREANEQLLVAIARAEKAERQAAEKNRETDQRIQESMESAAQLELKFMDAMKRIEGSTGMGQ
jgi:chromosome segregation ATPase